MDTIHRMLDNILLNAIKIYAGVHDVYPPDSLIAKWKTKLGIYWAISYRS